MSRDASATVTMPEPMSIFTDFCDCASRQPESAVNAFEMHSPTVVVKTGFTEEERTMSGLSPVARIASPSFVLRNSESMSTASATAMRATMSTLCFSSGEPLRASRIFTNIVGVRFMFRIAELPIIARFIEYSPVLTIIPARRLFMPIRVCRNAVIKPESIPASIAAGILRSGCPPIATTAPTAAPRVKQPSVERSQTFNIE